MKTHEIRYKLPEMVFGDSEVLYNPRSGLDVVTNGNEGRYFYVMNVFFSIGMNF